MMSTTFTHRQIEHLKPGPNRQELPDLGSRGLYLIIQPSGRKSWAVRYRIFGRNRKLTLGLFPALGLAKARSAAAEVMLKVDEGRDPAALAKAGQFAPRSGSLRDVLAEYDRRHLSKLKSGRAVLSALERYALPRWSGMALSQISRADIRALLDDMSDNGTPVMANRVRAYLSGLFKFAQERDLVAVNPVQGTRPFSESARDRFLSDREIVFFWKASYQLPADYGACLRLLLLTGARRNEVAEILAQTPNARGYLRVAIGSKRFRVNRLVCGAFAGLPANDDMQASHQNGVRTDNSIANLAWETPGMNWSRRFQHGTANPHAKLTDDQRGQIREMWARGGMTQIEIAERFGVSNGTISQITRGGAAQKKQLGPKARAQILKLWAKGGITKVELSERFGVSRTTVLNIIRKGESS